MRISDWSSDVCSSDLPGKKIIISGGGRCNFTNLHTAPDRYLSSNPHFAKSALSRYTAQGFIGMVDRYDIAWHEKPLGQLFCDGSARQIVEMLLEECAKGSVERSEENTSELQSLMRSSFPVFFLII